MQTFPSLKNCTMIKKILFLALAAVLMTACAFSLPGKFTQLADKVAAKGADYTPAQWEKANAQFEALVNQYVDKYDKLSNEDKKEINAAIGKYTATALKCGVADGLKQINALLKKVPSAIDTAAEGAKGFFEELGLWLPPVSQGTALRPGGFLLPRQEIIRIFDGPSFPLLS